MRPEHSWYMRNHSKEALDKGWERFAELHGRPHPFCPRGQREVIDLGDDEQQQTEGTTYEV